MLRIATRVLAGASLLSVALTPLHARQTGDTSAATTAKPATPAVGLSVPFSVGERLEYEVRAFKVGVGKGSMEVREIIDVRGKPTWHTIFRIKGGVAFYKVNDTYESWFEVGSLTSRRYHQDIDQGSYERRRKYEFFPERGMYQENDKPEQPTVESPLDDGSFLYFVRTIPLEVGKEYTFSRYFNPASNPVTIKVLRRETVKVPAGTFETVVLQPTFQTKGLFSKNGEAEVWISDDSRRIMVQMKSKLSFGSLALYLRSHNTITP